MRLEKGIKIMPAKVDPQGYEHSDITVFNLRKMSDESIEKHGLMKYVKQMEDYKATQGLAETNEINTLQQ